MTFEKAFIQCLRDGVYPGPSNINERRGKGRFNRLNGQDTTHRRQLMFDFGVPFQRGHGKYWDGIKYVSDKGRIPDGCGFTFINGVMTKLSVGWRKSEIMDDPTEPWQLRRK